MKALLVVALIGACWLGRPAFAQGDVCQSSFTIESNTWKFVGVPCQGQTYAEVFGALGTLGVDYIYHVHQNGSYLAREPDGLIVPGQGFWLIQVTGGPVELTSQGTYPSSTVEIDGSPGLQYSIVSNPTNETIDLINARVNPEAQNTSIAEAISDGKIGNTIYAYRNGAFDFIVGGQGSLDPWEGAWFRSKTLKIDFDPKAVIPEPSEKVVTATIIASREDLAEGFRNPSGPGFGAYAIKAHSPGGKILLGTANSYAAGSNGAAVTLISPDGSVDTNQLNQQGYSDQEVIDGRIFILGADPAIAYPHSDHPHAWGSMHILDPQSGSMTDLYNLPFTFHGWGITYDANTQTLYYAGSGVINDHPDLTKATYTAFLFASTDFGQTWTQIGDRYNGAGEYRMYDVIIIGGEIYTQSNDALQGECYISRYNGLNFERIPGAQVACSPRLYNIDGYLVANAADANSLIVIDVSNDSVISVPYDDFEVYYMHYLAQDEDRIYTTTNDGRIMTAVKRGVLTGDPVWEEYFSHPDKERYVAIAHDPSNNSLIVSTLGEEATVYRLTETPQ